MRLSTTYKHVRPCSTSNVATSCDKNIGQNPLIMNNVNTKPTKKDLSLVIQEAPRKFLESYFKKASDWKKSSSSMSPSWLEPGKVSSRWKDYQGIKNWEGLLDPLDDNLRCEIIRYGNFVEAAYESCDMDPSSSSYGECRYPKRCLLDESGMGRTGYRVTKNLVANSGIRLPGWVDRAPSWMAMQSSWIGYVAVCQDKKEIARLGRRDVVIAFRGTITCLEWLENLRATLTPVPDSDADSDSMVESGFLSLYTSGSKTRQSLQNVLRQEISRILRRYENENLSFTITGHSLGAALATLAAYDIKKTFKNSPSLVTVISFAGPRVGNWSFRCELEKQNTKVLRIVNSDDVVTKVPGFVVDHNRDHAQSPHRECSGRVPSPNKAAKIRGWVQKLVHDAQLVYADVGCELRLSSRDSPYLDGINIAGCHDLKTYLHLVNGFESSNCPFRESAKRMMNKTLVNS